MRRLLSLVMIVKNEARSLREVLDAVLPHVDRGTILDTGSTDGTQDIVREAFAAAGKPLTLAEEPFIDFAASRNRALQIDKYDYEQGMEWVREDGTVFQFMLSGDEHMHEGALLREHLEKFRDKRVADDGKDDPNGKTVDCHWVQLAIRGVRLFTPRVFRTESAWRYEGVVHEIPVNRSDSKSPMANVHGCGIEHRESDPESRYNNIWELHIPLLKGALEKNPEDERALMFLAQSYEALIGAGNGFDDEEKREYATEAMKLRLRRDKLPTGGKVERAYNQMLMLDDARLTGVFSDRELFAWAETLYAADPQRPETALLCAELSMKVMPLQKVFELAANAAKVASESKQIDNSSPIDMSIEWRAHHLAANAAKQLSKKYPEDFGPFVDKHVEAGLAAGGPWPAFHQIVAEPDEATEPE